VAESNAEAEQAELVHLGIAGQVATVTLDSPHNRNALSRRLMSELTAHFAALDERDDVRIVVLTHTGGTFCAGADMAEAIADGMEQGSRSLLAILRRIVGLTKPVMAVVDGHVRAGGLGLVGACDFALVSTSSTFAFSESLLGLAPAVISLTTRDRMVDRDAALKFLSGVTFDGAEAARAGLVTLAVPAESLATSAVGLQAEILKASPQGLRETKTLLNRRLVQRIDDDGPELVALSARLFASPEAREGMTAFKERRPPSWARDLG
jgi:enoyl-CoA hydratase/carnithine racemase